MSPQGSIAHYRIVSKLGEGGMGAVYRATDTKLNRDVAIKVLPPAFAEDTARMARFEREAQALAALNHPNIASIYAIEQGAIVMELVDGKDLAGPLPADTAIEYAKQIAAALEAAHEKGIIHRDLKPSNIRVTVGGAVKLLDFGLATAPEQTGVSSAVSPTFCPTLSLAMTEAGMLLGTAAYMSPEQARGKPVDKRTDIWAFGVTLYEMLTGSRPYGGETAADTLAAIVLKEPDYSALPAGTPPRVRTLIDLCLRKDPKQRLRDIGDASLILEEPEPVASQQTAPPARRRALLPWMIAGIAVAALAGLGAMQWFGTPPATAPPARFVLPLPEGTTESTRWGVTQAVPSPDGSSIVYVAATEGRTHLWLRPLGSPTARRLERTEGAGLPFWSPDSQNVAFFADDKLKKISIAGGPPLEVCTVPGEGIPMVGGRVVKGDGGTWNREGVIVFAPGGGPLLRVLADGGAPTPVTTLASGVQYHSWPQFLPDGQHLLYFEKSPTSGTYLQRLGSSDRTLVMMNTAHAAWAPPGYLLFIRETSLFAQKINQSAQLTGEPVLIAQDVTTNEASGGAAFAASGNGVLVYRSGIDGAVKQVVWRDRQGRTVQEIGKQDLYICLRRSRDEKKALLGLGTGLGKLQGWELTVMDMTTGVVSRVTDTPNPTVTLGPWSPDDRRIAVNRRNARGITEVVVASGQKRELGEGFLAEDWFADGKPLLCRDSTGRNLATLDLEHPGQFRTVSETSYARRSFRLAPGGRHVAFESQESRGTQIVIASFPRFDDKRQVSVGGGSTPVWRADGKELFFLAPDWTLMSVDVQTANGITATAPRALFKLPLHPYGPYYEVSADGKRILVLDNPGSSPSAQINVLVNWTSELKQ
jgi:eukaryotic-like serine/threonine-protein kinase